MKQNLALFTLSDAQLLMNKNSVVRPTPWDSNALDMPSWEILEYNVNIFQEIVNIPGHYTIKVNPLDNKALLNQFGFYYCDTLLEPSCSVKNLNLFKNSELSIAKNNALKNEILNICENTFFYGRFHRDFNISNDLAERRYLQWLERLLAENQVYGLFWNGKLGGFIAYNQNSLVLHAISKEFRGRSLSKCWWSLVCDDLFLHSGYTEIISSISSSNLPALNLYASLGFVFKKAVDVYHCVIK